MVQWIKVQPAMITSQHLGLVSVAKFLSQLPANASGKTTEEGPSVLTPDVRLGSQDGILDFCL